MRLIEDPNELVDTVGCALVPTMGALHEGHASLIRAAAGSGLGVVVTIFVNPTQFGPREDFLKYPRTLNDDLAVAESAGARVVFVPGVDAIYPRGLAAARAEAAVLPLPPAAHEPHLEDACRPTHMAGVCQVVARLCDLLSPAVAYFGEKDFQQLRVIEQMVAMDPTRWPALRVLPCPTIREPDGLAMSSRNVFLNAEERLRAAAIPRALLATKERLAHGESVNIGLLSEAESEMRVALAEAGLGTQYAVIRNSHTLMSAGSDATELRALVAARLGGARLIDNMEVWTRGQGG